jgi:hypothetical protein
VCDSGAIVRSVPAKRVLSHDRRRDLLCADTLPLTAAAASTGRRHSAVAGSVHPSRSAAWNRAIRHAAPSAGHRAGTLVSDALVPVPASYEEHGCAVGNGTCNSAGSDTSRGLVDWLALANVVSVDASIASSSSSRRARHTSLVWRTGVTRESARWQWAGSVDECSKLVDSGVRVAPERIGWISELSL